MQSLFNPYQVLWVMVFFDLPTETKKQRKAHTQFRKNLEKAGFDRFQLSIYVRHSLSRDNAERYQERVRRFLPEEGLVGMLTITDKQFGMIELFHGRDSTTLPQPTQQLDLF